MRCTKAILIINRLRILLFSLITFSHPSQAQVITIGGVNSDMGRKIITSSDKGYVIVGHTASYGQGSLDIYVLKTDSAGNLEWAKTIGGTDQDWGLDIAQTSDGGYIIAGRTYSFCVSGCPTNPDVYVVKIDASGNVEWTRTIGGSGIDYGQAVVETTDGGYIIVGSTDSYGQGGLDVYIIKLDNTGNLLWTKTIGGVYDDYGRNIIRTSDGNMVIVGYTLTFTQGWHDIYLIKLDNSGNVLWTKTIGGTDDERGISIIETPDKGFAIAGTSRSFGQGGNDVYVIKTDSLANVIWSKTIGGTGDEWGTDLLYSPEGSFVVVGWTTSFGPGNSNVYVVKLDEQGNLIWTRTIGGQVAEYGYSITLSSTAEPDYIITGWTSTLGNGDYDLILLQMDTGGNIITTGCFDTLLNRGALSTGWDTLSGGIIATVSSDTASGGIASSGAMVDVCVPFNTCDNFSVSFTKGDLSCAGSSDGWIKVTPTGGTPPYYHSWTPTPPNSNSTSDSIWGLGAGIWIDTISDFYGCQIIVSVEIIEPPALTVDSINIQNPSACGNNDGEATIYVSGGTPPYSYQWSNGSNSQTATSLSAGTYTVTVTDANGCSITQQVSLSDPNAPNITLDSIVHVACSGESTGAIFITVTGGTPPYTYNWSPIGSSSEDISNLSAGTYTVTVVDANNCSSSRSFTISELAPPLLVNIDTSNLPIVRAYAQGGTPPYVFLWNTGSSSDSISISSSGLYWVRVEDSLGCVAYDSIYIKLTSVNTPLHHSNEIAWYQRENTITLYLPQGTWTIHLSDISGKTIITYNDIQGSSWLNIPLPLSNGIYIIQLTSHTQNHTIKIKFSQ